MDHPPPHHFSNGPPLSMICTADGSAWNQIKPYKMNYITYTVQTNASHISLKQLQAESNVDIVIFNAVDTE